MKWHRKAAEQGLARAQLLLAIEYANGAGVKIDRPKAAEWLRKAAEQGLPEAQLALGNCHAHGDGVSENPVEAVKWYRRAADQDMAEAEYELGKCYLTGAGVPENIAEGIKWTWKATSRAGICPGPKQPRSLLAIWKAKEWPRIMWRPINGSAWARPKAATWPPTLN